MSDELTPLQKSVTIPSGMLSIKEEQTPPRNPKLVLVIAISAMILLIIGLGAWKALQISQAIAMGKAFKMPPDAVTTVTVSEETISPVLEAVGSISSPQGVMLSADLPGTLKLISFESGSHATNGQLLVQLDTRQEEAQLRTAKAKLELALQSRPSQGS